MNKYALGLLFFACMIEAAEKKPVTLDAVLNQQHAATPTPIWSPDGKQFAVVEQQKVKLYDAATGQSRDFFNVSDLTRQARQSADGKPFGWRNRRVSDNAYQWFANGKEMLAAVDGALFVVHANGKNTRLTRTDDAQEDPKLSPDGTQILYRSKSNLNLLNIASKKVTALTSDGTATLLNGQADWVYPEELDLGAASWWSPDSKKIAFLQFDVGSEFVYPQIDLIGERALAEPERYPQSGTPNAQVRIGIIDIASGGAVQWMDLGSTENSLLARAVWLPDSRTLAVERLSRLQDRLELLLCDTNNGRVHRVLKEESKTWINFTDNFYPLPSGREFLWTSESSGFRHIYRYSARGELLGQLTSGDWEVREICAIDESKQLIYFTSSEAGALETQLYAVGFQGGDRRRITSEEGSHVIRANADGSTFIDRFSNFQQPLRVLLKNAAGNTIKVLVEPDKTSDEYTLLPSETIEVRASDGRTLFGRLTKPANYQAGTKYPLIVQVYGGPGVQTVRNEWSGVNWGQMMAQKGYVVFRLDNRGSSGRGHAFEEPIFHAIGEAEVADQKAGVRYLIGSGLVDPERVGITGWSYGGFMTIHSLLFAPDVFKVGVAGAPVTDWHNYDTIYTERYMGLPEKNREAYDATSNVKNAEKLRGKLLIVHNIEDDNVLFQNTMQMADALERADKRFFMQIYPQKTHGVSGPLTRALEEATTDFFDRNLGPAVQILH